MDDQACPRCKTTKYRNPSLKLMVNVCGHTLCEACVDLLFLKGSGSCPQCMVPLRRNNFRLQLFEDPMVEKEVDIRRRILRDYNKKQDDFDTIEEYNNYLEEIENIIFNLANDINIIETNKMVDSYKRENREQIQRNKVRTNRDDGELEEMIALEHVQEKAREIELHQIETEQKIKRARGKEELLENLMNGDKDAKDIVKEFAEQTEKQREEEKKLPPMKPISEFSSGIKFGATVDQTFLPLPKSEEGPTYVYQPLELPTYGPPPPSITTMLESNYVEQLRPETPAELAGGYRSLMACQRAVQSCYEDLFFKHPNI